MTFSKSRPLVKREIVFRANVLILCRFPAASGGFLQPERRLFMPEPFVVDGVWIPKAIVGIRSRYAVTLYLELRRHCFERPECFPGVRRLAHAVGCAVGTVSALTDQFHALGIVTKNHDGRRCVYRFAEGCWRRRKARKTAHRSANRTEDKSTFGVFTDIAKNHKTNVSLERRAKRSNMIKSLKRWVELSPHLTDSERPHRLAVLDRAEAALDNWGRRSAEDKRCFEMLVGRARVRPLDSTVTDSLRQRPVGMASIGAFLPAFGST
jgi:hypothetical protein